MIKIENNQPANICELHGEVEFNFNSHNGQLLIGVPAIEFTTTWSRAGHDSIYSYSSKHTSRAIDVESIGIAENISNIHEVQNSHFETTDFSFDVITASEGQIILMKHPNGFTYGAVKILKVINDRSIPQKSKLQIRFAIDATGNADFSRFTDDLFLDDLRPITADTTAVTADSTLNNNSTMKDIESQAPEVNSAPDIDSSDWTGLPSLKQSSILVKQLVPEAISAVDILINEHENKNHNGGPPLEDDQEILDKLKGLRDALTGLIEIVETNNLDDLPNALRSGLELASSVKGDISNNKLSYAILAMIEVSCLAIGIPSSGLLTGLIRNYINKKSE